MTDRERIDIITRHLGINVSKLASSIGELPQVFYDIRSEKSRISRRVAQKIKEKYPDFSEPWLLTGTGDMLAGTQHPSTPTPSTYSALNADEILNSRYVALLEKYAELQEKYAGLLEEIKLRQTSTENYRLIMDNG